MKKFLVLSAVTFSLAVSFVLGGMGATLAGEENHPRPSVELAGEENHPRPDVTQS